MASVCMTQASVGFGVSGSLADSWAQYIACVEGFPQGALSACGSGGLEELLSAPRGAPRVYFWDVSLCCHEDPLCRVEYPTLGVRFEDVDRLS